ncbi:hypothetical protein QNH23_08990 [Siminovitchia fortis]|uniref:Membrane protein YkvI n=1 Tax=Siminovitchia fortis TaxID=254758 RepID=A0A451GBP0_9BACI|nr:hypothetical protein [Siminovitchia fortis]RWR12436.1 hypothetical protein D4N35_007000 [Siminovitchia fortis]WHY83483.1 hypothetical protein QNH23_08990 [Siminovitchia fortis]
MRKWSEAFQVASVYVGTIVGAGFATGREIVEFFTRFGFYGTAAIFLAGVLFIVLGSKIMLVAIDIRAKSFEQLNEYLFGRRLALVMNIFLMLMLTGVCAVMLSGAEALFTEQLRLPQRTGLVFTVILTLIVMAAGVKGLFAVNTFVVPMMVVFNFLVMLLVMNTGSRVFAPVVSSGWEEGGKAVLSAFSYAAFNLALAQAVLVPMAAEIKDRSAVKRGGVIGGLLLTVILSSSHISLGTLSDPASFDIPMAVIVEGTAGTLYFLYLLIIYGEIFTSVIGNLYGLERQIRSYLPIHSLWIYICLLSVVYVISLVKYGTLLEILYPLFGYISIGFLFLLLIKPDKAR